jgi:outer membrane receptor protein involved in Fe transport
MTMRTFACGLGLIALNVAGHVQATERIEQISEVVVKGQIMKAEESAFTATVLSAADIRQQTPGDIDELFGNVPGMAVRDLQLGAVANSIVIRGFGNGGHGGDLGAVIDGVPLNEAMSHADGYVDLNTVIPLEIESFTVFKGPVSALYGNYNRGGLVNIQTRKGGDYLETDLSLGSFETMDVQAAYGVELGESRTLNLAGQVYRAGGYRSHSDSRRAAFAGRWSANLTSALELALSTRYLASESDSASYLTLQQFQADPRGIDSRVQGDGADKEFLTARADANYALTENLKLLTFGYATRQDFTRYFTRPIDASTWLQREETYDRAVYGAGTSLNGLQTLAGKRISYVAGIETFRESTEFKFFDGLDNRRRVRPAQSDRDTALNSVSAFAEVEADVHPLAQLFAGVRADRFTGGCELRGSETGTDPCGALKSASHVSPKLGVRSEVSDRLQLRASWSEGFALANGFVKYSVGGQPLDENVFRQTEVGVRFNASEVFELDVAAYRLTSTGEVRTISPGVYENYGATLRRGIEAGAVWKPSTRLELSAVYGLSDTEVERNADVRLQGLGVPGVPEQSGSFEARFRPFTDWTLSATWRYVGEYEIDALNTLQAPSYGLVDLGVAYTRDAVRSYRLYARVDNVTDKQYATSVSLIGGQQLVAPGMPRALRAGIQLNF